MASTTRIWSLCSLPEGCFLMALSQRAILVVSVSVSARPYLTWLTPLSQFVAEFCSSLLTFFNWWTAEELIYSLVVWLWPSWKVATFTVIASQRGLSVSSSLALHVHRRVHAFNVYICSIIMKPYGMLLRPDSFAWCTYSILFYALLPSSYCISLHFSALTFTLIHPPADALSKFM